MDRRRRPGAAPSRTASALDRARRAQVTGNERGIPDWERYEGHRAEITAHLLRAGRDVTETHGRGARLALLGAGNGNDVDLATLLAPAGPYDRVTLVDIDEAALGRAVARVPEELRPRIERRAPVDLSGLLASMDGWRDQVPSARDVGAAAEAGLGKLVQALAGPFDVVASLCLMTQMSWTLTDLLGGDHPLIGSLREVVMVNHLRGVASCLVPGGLALVINDLISSEYHPLDELPPGTDLEALMGDLVRAGNYYHGSNPQLLLRLLRRPPALAAAFEEPRFVGRWLWAGALERTYLVYALAARRRAEPTASA